MHRIRPSVYLQCLLEMEEQKRICLALGLMGRHSVFHHKNNVNNVIIDVFYQVKKVPFYPYLGKRDLNGYWILSNGFFVSMGMIMCFLSCVVLIWFIILVDFQMLRWPSIPGVNLLIVYNLFYMLLI